MCSTGPQLLNLVSAISSFSHSPPPSLRQIGTAAHCFPLQGFMCKAGPKENTKVGGQGEDTTTDTFSSFPVFSFKITILKTLNKKCALCAISTKF